jgi:hypothetical protein
MEADFSWIYLIIFLMIPLARILPRVLKKLKSGNSESQEIPPRQFESNFNRYEDQPDNQFESNSTEYQEPLKSSKTSNQKHACFRRIT